MNRHFKDARYYLKRAAETSLLGIREELAPVEARVRRFVGREREVEAGRFDEVKADFEDVGDKARGEAKAAVSGARKRISDYRRPEA